MWGGKEADLNNKSKFKLDFDRPYFCQAPLFRFSLNVNYFGKIFFPKEGQRKQTHINNVERKSKLVTRSVCVLWL